MSKRKKTRERHVMEATTIEIEGDRITVIKDREIWEPIIDQEKLPRYTIDVWKQRVSEALSDQREEEVSPDTIDIYTNIRPVRECPSCHETIHRVSARFCPMCGRELPE